MRVLHDRVMLKKNDPETVSTGGIVIASSAVEPKHEATVIAVGNGHPVEGGEPIPLTVKVGDQVMYNPQAAVTIKVEGEDLLVIKEDDIYLVFE